MIGRRELLALLAAAVPALDAVTSPGPAAGAAAADPLTAADPDSYLSALPGAGRFPLVAGGRSARIVVDPADHPGVVRVAADLRDDVRRVTGVTPELLSTDRLGADLLRSGEPVVLVGTLGRSRLVDPLVAAGAVDTAGVAGRWETSLQQVVAPTASAPGGALVIAGSDQRGTIYGVYDVSRRIGVSPWWWWDDVPPRQVGELYVLPGRHSQGTPAVRYRGVFVNDENPATGTWARNTFGAGLAPGYPGGLTRAYYARVFELLLRLKGNYLWPAVWGRAFAEDDPANHATATAYGVVIGTSHEAPMMRGIEEWNRHASSGGDPYGGNGKWSFRSNRAALEAYWTAGIRRMVDEGIEGVVTLGMRGTGDTSLPDGDGIDLMREILASEREILGRVTGRELAEIPQIWSLYKEVQRYWDSGLRPPDDVTVVFTDDNWGNLRRVPDPALPPRAGGYGLYYHFDYVGAGRNYKWVDTISLVNTWEQLNQAHRFGVDRLWVVNAGDLKDLERPVQFFLDHAWDPERWTPDTLSEWERRFAAENFGSDVAPELAAILHEYGALQALRKPELLNRAIRVDPSRSPADPRAVSNDDQASPFSLVVHGELDRVTARWQALAARAERLGATLPEHARDAWFQLVDYPVGATANLYALRRAEFTNLLHARQGRAGANALAEEAEARFADDQALSARYNDTVAGGKWRGWQTQAHIGYGDTARYGGTASWQDPQRGGEYLPDAMFPPVRRIEVPQTAELGVAVEGSTSWWPGDSGPAQLPPLNRWSAEPVRHLEVFNRGSVPFDVRIETGVPWLTAEPAAGTVTDQVRVQLRCDPGAAPSGTTTVPVLVTGAGRSVEVLAVVENPELPEAAAGFVEACGHVVVRADHHDRAVSAPGVSWTTLPDLGRCGNAVAVTPCTAAPFTPGGDGPRLEYTVTLTSTGPVTLWVHLAPRNSVLPGRGMRYAVSLDDDPPQLVDATSATGADDTAMNAQWARNTSDAVNRTATRHLVRRAGVHTVRFWLVDPTVVLTDLILDTGGLPASYLGPPESLRLPGPG